MEAKHENKQVEETTAPAEAEGEWIEVPKRTKKNKGEGQVQPGNRGAKSEPNHGGRGNHQTHSSVDEEQKEKWNAYVFPRSFRFRAFGSSL